MKYYNLVVCGATLDHFHKGHEAYLRFALSQADKILLGLTSDSFAKEKAFSERLEPYEKRKEQLIAFLKRVDALDRVEITAIDDIYIPKSWEDLPIEAIIVSEATRTGAQRVNKRRKLEGKAELAIVPFSMVFAEDGTPIASKRIREGAITREGKLTINPLWLNETLLITEELRLELKKPLGKLTSYLPKFSQQQQLVTVGDVVTKSCNDAGVGQRFSVVDFHVGRKKMFESLSELSFGTDVAVVEVKNPRGSITARLFRAAKELFQTLKKECCVILVEGEEDLAVLPMVLASPLGFAVAYGQSGEGVVVVEVTEEAKERIFAIVSQFSTP